MPEGFFQADVYMTERRHLIFATVEQLTTVTKAKSWDIDGTFKLVQKPFRQLVMINAFVPSGDHTIHCYSSSCPGRVRHTTKR